LNCSLAAYFNLIPEGDFNIVAAQLLKLPRLRHSILAMVCL
jgi:hypothetical protein